MISTKRQRRGLITLFLLFTGLALLRPVVAQDNSDIHRIFIHQPFASPTLNRWDYVEADFPLKGERESLPLVKRIAGVPGDYITLKKSTIYINDRKIGFRKSRGPGGDALPNPPLAGLIPGDHFFLTGTGDSYDSRYLGLFRRQWIKGKLFPLLKRGVL